MNDLVERLRDGLLFDADVDCRDDGTCRDILIEAADRLEATERLVEELEAALTEQIAATTMLLTRHGYDDQAVWDCTSQGHRALASIADWRKP